MPKHLAQDAYSVKGTMHISPSTPTPRRPSLTPEVDEAKAIAQRLKRARKWAGYPSAGPFASAAGIDKNTYYRYERGQQRPGLDALLAAGRTAHVSVDWLAQGEDSCPPAFHRWVEEHQPEEELRARLAATVVPPYQATPILYDLLAVAFSRGLTGDEAAAAAAHTSKLLRE